MYKVGCQSIYIKLQCPFVCVSVCMWIDLGMVRPQKIAPKAAPKGRVLGGQKSKSQGNVMNCRENQYFFRGQHFKSLGNVNC